MNGSLTWKCFNIGKNGTSYIESDPFYSYEELEDWDGEILELWVISDYGLSEIVSQGLSTLGSVGIVGLYVTILVSLGALVRKVVPEGWSIIHLTLSDPLPLLQLIDIMEICRDSEYPYESFMK